MTSLKADDFIDDVEVRVGFRDQEIWLSERLFRRLVLVGTAYELHLLPMLKQDFVLNAVQAENLLGELEFVRALVADQALGSLLNTLTPIVGLACRSGDDVTFEWP